jgi:hypothetical protein
MVFAVVLFILACNFVTQPIKDAQNLAGTAQSLATAIPIQTLQALPSALPMETLEALPSVAPTIEALATDFGDFLNPQGTPVQEWKGIPIMPQATAGQEFTERDTYSFKAPVTTKDVQDFYNQKLTDLGWKQPFSVPGGAEGGIMTFQKDNSTLVVTITSSDNSVVVLLTLVS